MIRVLKLLEWELRKMMGHLPHGLVEHRRRLRSILIRSTSDSIWYWLTTLCLMPLYCIGISALVLGVGSIRLAWLGHYILLKWVEALRHWLSTTNSEQRELKSSKPKASVVRISPPKN